MRKMFLILALLQNAFFPTESWSQLAPGKPDKEFLSEEIFVHLSDQVLLTGEHLWLHTTVRLNGKPSPSVVAYMELLDREGNPVKQEMKHLTEGKATGFLEIPENLASDNYLLRVYTRNSPFFDVSRGIYHRIITVINPQSPPPSIVSQRQNSLLKNIKIDHPQIQPDKEIYGPKTQVSLSVKINPFNFFNLSVRKLPPLANYEETTIKAEEIYDIEDQDFVLIPEMYGHIVQGKSLSSKIDTTEIFYLSAHGNQANLFLTRPLENGNLFFETGAFKYFDYVIVQSSKSENQVDFILESPYFPQRPDTNFQLPTLHLSEEDKSFILDRLLATETGKYFHPSSKIPVEESPPFLNADKTYLLDDYTRFEDLATTLREYVPEVFVRSRNKKILFRNLNLPYDNIFQNDPLILIDAMPVFDSHAFSKLDPVGIKKLDVVNRYYFFQKEVFEGIISLTSYKNDFGQFDLPKNALFIEYPGIQIPKTVNFPNASQDEKRLPDFRNLLYWATEEKTNEVGEKNLTFTTSELLGFFEIRLSYFNEKDQWSEITKVIEVK